MTRPAPLVHCVTDRRRAGLTPAALVDRLAAIARSGADAIQIRERDLPDVELTALVRSTVLAVAGTAVRIIVNDRLDIAIAAGAAGVHLRGDSAPASRVRAIAPRRMVIGRSIHSVDEARAAEDDGGCDYLTFGTVFASDSKPQQTPAGLEALRAVCAATRLPVLAIGGVTGARVAMVLDAGAAGFAGVGGFG